MASVPAGVQGFRIWQPLYVHFHYDVFDVFTQRLKTTSEETILARKNLNVFKVFETKHQFNPLNMRQSLVANYVLGDFSFPFEFTNEHRDVWLSWLKRRQAITQVFQDDLKKLDEHAILKDPYRSQLFKLAVSGQVAPETVVILDNHIKFLDIWKSELDGTLHYEPVRIWAKYKNFVQYDKEKIMGVVKGWAAEHAKV